MLSLQAGTQVVERGRAFCAMRIATCLADRGFVPRWAPTRWGITWLQESSCVREYSSLSRGTMIAVCSIAHSDVENPLNILLIDDDPNLRKSFRLALDAMGHKVTQAGDSTQAQD